MKTEFVKAKAIFLNPRERISTGSGRLDALIAGIEQGTIYLFYGDQEPLVRLMQFLAIENLRKTNSPTLIITTIDYHDGLVLDVYDLAYTAVQLGLDPEYALKNIYVINVFNRRQATALRDILKFVEDKGIRLIVVWGLTRLFSYEHYPVLIKFLSLLKELQSQAAVVIFSEGLKNGTPPKPAGPIFLRHFPNVLVYFRRSKRFKKLVRAFLVKHPYRSQGVVEVFLDFHGLSDR